MSSFFVLSTALAGAALLVCHAVIAFLDAQDAKERARWDRAQVNAQHQAAWMFCCLAADGVFDTRHITDAEWLTASASIERELEAREAYGELCEGRR